jgi:hypothetical protein
MAILVQQSDGGFGACVGGVMVMKLGKKWLLSEETLPVRKSRVAGVKLKGKKVMWVGGDADDPADSNRAFIYHVGTRRFRETAPVPAAKPMDRRASVGVLKDGSVVVAGGPVDSDASRLSYRYDPISEEWHRTGDLPVRQQWLFMPTIRLRDGRLLIAGGVGESGVATLTGSLQAFIYDPAQNSTVAVIDPGTGVPTGETAVVAGKWDVTRKVENNSESTLGSAHVFGNSIRLKDGRVFVVGGHTFWHPNFDDGLDFSVLATETDYFDPATGVWTTGSPLPAVQGEDDRIPSSYGGRANGLGLAVMDNGKVVIAGGNSQVDNLSYFLTGIGRRSILVMTAHTNPMHSTYEIAPNRIPPGSPFGGLFGDGGRNQLLCYAVPGNRVVIAGGQDNAGGDLYDTYVFKYSNRSIKRGPDMAHDTTCWAVQHPELGFPPDYETAVISTLAVSMNNSRLVFGDGTLVHGGGYNGVGDGTFPGSRYAEQLACKPVHPTAQTATRRRESLGDRL